jgi:hypothetical protein
LVVWDICEFLAVELRDYELWCVSDEARPSCLLTAWPRDNGLMSRKANTLSLSKSLKEGMSPIDVNWACLRVEGGDITY